MSADTQTTDAERVADALALLWCHRPRTVLHAFLRQLEIKTETGRYFSPEDVKAALRVLRDAGRIEEHPQRQGLWRLREPLRTARYRALLEAGDGLHLRDALYAIDHYQPLQRHWSWPVNDYGATVALVRMTAFTGAPAKELAEIGRLVSGAYDWDRVLFEACVDGFDPRLFERIDQGVRWQLAYQAVASICVYWSTPYLPVLDWALEQLERKPSALPESMRYVMAEVLLHRGELARVRALLKGDPGGPAAALGAAALVQEGHWAEAQAAFEAALKLRKTETGAKKRLIPVSLSWYYPLCLLAQQTPKHLELARKYCLGEAGSRNPSPLDAWGSWCHAIAVRQGDAAVEHAALAGYSSQHPGIAPLWRVLLRAWLGAEAPADKGRKTQTAGVEMSEMLHEHLRACNFAWLDGQLSAAEAVIAGREPPQPFFVAGPRESWRAVLASLQALGAEKAEGAGDASASRILWSIRLGKQGSVEAIEPLEQKRGARGWGKPKAASLAKLAVNEKLEPWDAKVTRAIHRDRYGARGRFFDRAAAIAALVGHPAVVLAEAPEQVVDLIEGAPEMEVLREGDRYVISISPGIRAAGKEEAYYYDPEERKEAEALRLITVLRDSPQRLRLIRLTPAQRRAAQLVAGKLAVPASAGDELKHALQALSGHFQIQSDHAEAARDVPAETQLRAELSPAGDGLMLRLVVSPLGAEGARLAPGSGRARVMAAVRGESLGANRDLDAERRHLDAVLADLPFLDPPGRHDLVCEWLVEDPEQALAMVEVLPRLPAVLAVEWPKGQAVRVVSVDTAQLGLQVRTERDWFRLAGEARLDESLVLKLTELLAFAGSGKGRFMPMGKGVYAALTDSLRAKLADLAAVAEADKQGARIPRLAAEWLNDVLDGADTSTDRDFRQSIERLQAARDLQPALPKTLQAELRPYQEDGYAWAMRLAEAGFGACLADDMGLGKTLQALAVLLARGAEGPALVIAPTSVCGNWLAEAARFAPALNARIYGEEGERETLIDSAGPMDVVIVSYTLLQQAAERFAGRDWHTVVADEAQAIKNAAAKRSQAVFDLAAGFRLAMSGTPVENRLAELWSIMRFCNPGLLSGLSRFNERFAGPIERDRDREAQRLLRRLIGPFLLRRTKAQVLEELPPRTELVLSVTAEATESAHYEALRRQAVSEAEAAAAGAQAGQARMHVLAQLTRLRRAACDPRLVSPDLGLVGAKVQAFAALAEELAANGHKTLVFSQFVDFLTLLRQPLDKAGIAYQYLDGATPAAERSRRVAAFQEGQGDLFLISLKAGGFGLNLTAADYVVIADPWWNPAAEDQAMGRAHRIGQQRPVTVYRLLAKGTLEERIVALHHEKRALAEGILAEGEGAALPSTDDLIALIRG
jgi:superfamily II DNA or RNA helicase